jgi:transposase
MRKPIPVRRDFLALEQRRKRAAKLLAAGDKPAAVARAVGVSRQSVSRWQEQLRGGGSEALKGAGRAGRLPKLNRKQLKRVDSVLRTGAKANGFQTDLWTLKRVVTVVERQTGVRYHQGHVWKILGSLNWTLQRPQKRARERNEQAVLQWVQKTWPAVKKKPAGKKPGSFSKTRAE